MNSDLSKTEIIDKYRHFNVDHDWWEYVYEDFIRTLEEKGISVTSNEIQFTGFYSQGDGASFTGTIHKSDIKRFMDAHDLAEGYEGSYFFAKLEEFCVLVERTSSHYCHSNTMQIYIDDSQILAFDADGDVREEIYNVMYDEFNTEQAGFENKVTEICRGYADKLYRDLYEEYEYLTSDALVVEALEANGIFDKQDEGEEHGIRSN
jgi:hypothetical protein